MIIFTVGWLLIPTEDDQLSPATVAEVVEESPASPNTKTLLPDDDKTDPKSDVEKPINPAQNKLVNVNKPVLTASTLQAVNNPIEAKESLKELSITFKRDVLPNIPLLKVNLSKPEIYTIGTYRNQVLPMDVSWMYTYSEEGNEELKKSRKFRMLNGIISIAKSVNKSKLGFEDIRNAKNGFVNDELKYGVKVSDEDVVENDTKSDGLNK